MMERVTHAHDPVPIRYRGLWQRTLLDAPGMYDTTTLVYWLQTARWHVDIRIPASRPDFASVRSLAECDRAQLEWLAQQQGFAGITEVDAWSKPEICRWHRMVDFRPSAAMPDAGTMSFEKDQLVETGMHAVYVENWVRVPDADNGFAVLQQATQPGAEHTRLLLIAGKHVMHVRARSAAWLEDIPPDFDMRLLDDDALRAMLDFEISIGRRTTDGWKILHSTLPWRERQHVSMRISDHTRQPDLIDIAWEGECGRWRLLEWEPPTDHMSVRS